MATQDFASSSSSSAGSNAISSSSYDVFISFRGENTRYNFVSFLYKALKDAGINNAFLDSEKLWTGEKIGETLERAIKGSKIWIPVFSKGYADSKWCLRELVQIVECHKSNNRLILPIFYYVDPSDVRHQTGSFKNAFLEHEKKFQPHEVDDWRKALSVVGNLKGDVLLDDTKDQAKLVESVVERARQKLVDSTGFAKCKYSIDMDSRVNDLLSLLDIGSNDVRFVGICGSGGVGKTTLAQAVYNDILLKFPKHCFLSDIREKATQGNGLESLQNQFLNEIFKQDFGISHSDKGKKLIEERVCKEKVFLVLDDVDNKEHIDALAGSLSWFGYGSRVIITTRDERILNLANVDEGKIYSPPLLSHAYSLQLFSWHAFQTSQPPEDYKQLSHDVVYHSRGIPLILEVFGSSLSCVNNKDEWESMLNLLREIPPEKVQKRLRISYDNLENGYQKEIFLDAACFFIGWKEEDVISIWEAFGFHPKLAVPRLIKRSLLKFDYGLLKMHDCIRDMGREIVMEESRDDQGKRSRLWSYNDIVEVFEERKETDTIRGMICPLNYSRPPINLTTESLEMMPNLRLLNVPKLKFTCPNLYHRKLVYLSISDEDCNQLWNVDPTNEHKRFQNLKILQFEGCHSLSWSPTFSWFPSLKQLHFFGCPLVELDESIGQLNQLECLIFKPNSVGDFFYEIRNILRDDISRMTSLKKLPDSIGDLRSLIKLDLSYTMIEELPFSISRMSSLKKLILVRCKSLKKLPDSIGDLRSLMKLDLMGSSIEELPDNISKMNSLKELILGRCKSLKKLPDSIGELRSLVKLDLLDSSIEELPDNIFRMSSLKEPTLLWCKSLKKLPNSIGNLRSLVRLDLSDSSIEELPDNISRMSSLNELILVRCKSLKKLPDSIGDLRSLVKLDLSDSSIEELPDNISRMSSLKELNFYPCVSLKKLPDVALLEKLLGKSGFGNNIILHKLPSSMGVKTCLDKTGHMDNIDFNDDFLVSHYPVRLDVFVLPLLQSLPKDLPALKTLKILEISYCNQLEYLPELPSCLVELCCRDCQSLVLLPDWSASKTLRRLEISFCGQLEYLPKLPSCLVKLYCEFCDSLVRLPDLSKLKMLTTLKLQYCKKLEEVSGLEEIVESLDELDTEGSYNLTTGTDHKRIQGILSPCNMSTGYSLTANQRIYDSGIILCLVRGSIFFNPAYVEISASIHQKDKKIRCTHTLRVADDEYCMDRDVIHISHFKGFTWFGVPLQQETDAIEILEIQGVGCRVKFWEVLFKNGDVIGTRKPCQNYLNSLKWSYMDDDGGLITLDYWPNQQQIRLPPDSVFNERAEEEEEDGGEITSESVRKDGEMLRPSKRARLHDKDDQALVPYSLSLSLTCRPGAEVLRAKSLPNKEKEEEEERNKMLLRAGYKNGAFLVDEDLEDAETSPSLLTLDLAPPRSGRILVDLNDDGANQKLLEHPSLVQETGKAFLSEYTQVEEEEEEEANNVRTVDFLSRVGLSSISNALEEEEVNNVPTEDFSSSLPLDSVSDEMAEEEDLLRQSYRHGHRSDNDHDGDDDDDDDDEGPDRGRCFCFHPFMFLCSLLFRS